ncbi:type I-E CRISPR-associated protein Cse2/CasB [Lacticaseibacillus thailandensis]|uniref:Crispr-associated protein, cse2 family n=1 Tax=Lacticaseibacillus thailandensis DSM 22698 = JCM 13996 TaxID=1423810 RepID=A0A0R2CHE8_9LACO|nr:type I-E CRISPR-associated protein Cse2/CasB [Lacticaseibacillus thailandensis]KRM87628.1 crispr-associated protein, cse2 family [Lacticaseibacillus thailandensis DSM 22698 = JCM 13996]
MMVDKVAGPTSRIITALYNDGAINRAALAGLRSAPTLNSPQAQVAWPIIMQYMSSNQLSHNGVPTYAEVAIFTAVKLYAQMQQGATGRGDKVPSVFGSHYAENEHQRGQRFFECLARMRQNPDAQVALDRRVRVALSTTSVEGLIHSLTGLNAIIKSTLDHPRIDYADLASDIYAFQFSFESANRVHLHWGQSYFGSVVKANSDEKEVANND